MHLTQSFLAANDFIAGPQVKTDSHLRSPRSREGEVTVKDKRQFGFLLPGAAILPNEAIFRRRSASSVRMKDHRRKGKVRAPSSCTVTVVVSCAILSFLTFSAFRLFGGIISIFFFPIPFYNEPGVRGNFFHLDLLLCIV